MRGGQRGERLQKVLSRAGVASRRKAERLIAEGRVAVDGKVIREPGTRVDTGRSQVAVDGMLLEREPLVYYLLYKPPMTVSTLRDPEGRPCVGDLIRDVPERVFSIGRLDYDAEGVLLITNDGELAHRLAHPSFGVRRIYDAKVKGVPSEAVLDLLREGVRLPPLPEGPPSGSNRPARVGRKDSGDGRRVRPLFVEVVGRADRNTWVRVGLTEGRQHLVKRMFMAVGHPVQRLRRIDYGGLNLEGMRPGDLRRLGAKEVEKLRRVVMDRSSNHAHTKH